MYTYKITYTMKKYLNRDYKNYILRVYKNDNMIKYYETFSPLIIRDILNNYGLDDDTIFIYIDEEKPQN